MNLHLSRPPQIRLQNVTIQLGGRQIVHPASFDLAGGLLVALIGPNGAGKTTLLKAIAGLLPHGGEININGESAGAISRKDRARLIGYLPQGHQVHWPLPAEDIVALGRFPHGAVDPRQLSDSDDHIVHEAMRATGTRSLAGQSATTLSGGERARIMLARVLAVDSPILLADEPTASLDPRHQLVVMDILRQQARNGRLVIAVTHDLTLAARMADQVILMADGAVVAIGTPQSVLTEQQLAKTYGIRVLRLDNDGETALIPWDVEAQP